MRARVMEQARQVAAQAVKSLSASEQEQLFGLIARLSDNLKDR